MEIDREGIVRRVNRLECKLRGREANDLLGVHCAELIPEIERKRYREQIQRKIEGHSALGTYHREYPAREWAQDRSGSTRAIAQEPGQGDRRHADGVH